MHILAVSEQGASVHAEGDLLLLRRGEAVLRKVRAGDVEQVLLFGGVEVSSGALRLLLRREIDLVLLTQAGDFRGRLCGRGSRNVVLRLAQYQRATDPAFAVGVARSIAAGKIRNQRQILLRAQRRLKDDELAVTLGSLRLLARRAAECTDVEVLRGLEGQAAALYFGHFGKLLRNEQFVFDGRNRRPPRDPVNALLSFGYAVLGSVIETELYRCGMEPMLGFFHQPAYGRPSLMLDLLEEFRPLVDTLVLRLLNRRQLSPGDFQRRAAKSVEELLAESPPPAPATRLESCAKREVADSPDPDAPDPLPWEEQPASPEVLQASLLRGEPPEAAAAEPGGADHGEVVGVFLSDVGRKIFLTEVLRRLKERLYYPPRGVTLELRDVVRQQIYHMARVVQSKDPEYVPFATE